MIKGTCSTWGGRGKQTESEGNGRQCEDRVSVAKDDTNRAAGERRVVQLAAAAGREDRTTWYPPEWQPSALLPFYARQLSRPIDSWLCT